MLEHEYFDAHIPHRVNVMIAFRQHYSGKFPGFTLNPETSSRYLVRCAKDISFVMVRFFLEEMGAKLAKHDKPKLGIKANEIYKFDHWKPRFGITRIEPSDLVSDRRHCDLCDVLKAANRAVAHMDDPDVDHTFKIDSDNQRIFGVIDWVEELVQTNIYTAAGKDFLHSMSLPNNDMYVQFPNDLVK